jgi:hypothetical protein
MYDSPGSLFADLATAPQDSVRLMVDGTHYHGDLWNLTKHTNISLYVVVARIITGGGGFAMYRIIGADGVEYGPVGSEQVRQWILDGRVNANTRVRPDSGSEWVLLGSLPEFANVLPRTEPPVVAMIDQQRWEDEILARDWHIDIGSCIGSGWDLIKSDFWMLVGASVVATLIASGGFIPYVSGMFALILGGPMIGGLYGMLLKKIRRQPASFPDIFLGFSVAFVPLMLTSLIAGILTGLGLLLCILPGIYLGVSWIFSLALVMDRKMDFWPAMELSRKVVSKHWWLAFGLAIVIGLVAILGLLACFVGVLVTIAIAEAALMHAYEDIFGPRNVVTL